MEEGGDAKRFRVLVMALDTCSLGFRATDLGEKDGRGELPGSAMMTTLL